MKLAVTLGDGFNGGNVPLDRVAPVVRELRDEATRVGRDPAQLEPSFQPVSPTIDRVLTHLEKLAPGA